MKVLALALTLCFAAGPLAAATKTYRPSSHSRVKHHSKVKKGPKASKLKRANTKRPKVN
jgi:hypothetical protein